jgi:hypothetical protein
VAHSYSQFDLSISAVAIATPSGDIGSKGFPGSKYMNHGYAARGGVGSVGGFVIAAGGV